MSLLSGDDANKMCLKMKSKGASLEDLLQFLRNAGFSQGISIFVIAAVYGIEHTDAKYKVLHSEVWSDNFDANIAIQKHLEKFFEEDCDQN